MMGRMGKGRCDMRELQQKGNSEGHMEDRHRRKKERVRARDRK
jgi:hypothetical protein